MNYLGYTLDDINTILFYDPDTGEFFSKKTGKKLVDIKFSYRHPKTKKVASFHLHRVAVMMMRGDYLVDGEEVICKDGDRYNLKYSNLVVVNHKSAYPKQNHEKNCYLETDEDYIFVGTLNKLFVVRRGPEQAVYRTYSKEKAIGVRDRWLESGKVLHEWDETMPKRFTF